MRFRTVGLVAVAALVAAPVVAEKAFIPVADGAGQRTEISLANAQGARAATVLARIGYEAGGASAQQAVTLGGGQSLRLSGLSGNGLVELDLAKGVKATATLVVERPGGQAVRAPLPVLTVADNMPAGSNASLKLVNLPDDYRKVAVGAVNLSSRAMRCEARFHDFDGKQLAPSIAFTVAPFSERRAGSFAGSKGRVDVDSLNTVRCDQPFWTYALVEQPKTGDVGVIYPTKEVELVAAPVTTEGTLSYTINGVFLVARPAQWSYRYHMSFSSRTIRQIFTQVTVYNGGWDPEKPDGFHLVVWLQKDKWINMLQYFNALKKGFNKFRWNYGGRTSFTRLRPGFYVGRTYLVKTWWDGVRKKNGYSLEKGGVFLGTNERSMTPTSITTDKLFIQFANDRNLDPEPEAHSPGWKWSDLKIDIVD